MAVDWALIKDESRLVRAAQAGDQEAFDQLVRLHQARLRGLAARFIMDSESVYELVQDAFVDAWKAMPRFDTTREFGPWLRTLCKNRVISHLRRQGGRSRAVALIDAAVGEQAESGTDGHDRLSALQHCLGGLRPDQRDLLHERYTHGEAVQSVARRLGKSETAVSMILLRLRDTLARCIANQLRLDTP